MAQKMKNVADLVQHHIPIDGNVNRIGKLFRSAFNAYRYPTEGQHLSHLGDLSGYYCLVDIQKKMRGDPVGRRILEEMPRVNSETMNLQELNKLGKNTFGYRYSKFMLDRDFSSDERPKVQHISDLELAYIYQRYKEIHDFIHTLLGQEVDIHGEIVVKWFEMAQLGLPSTTLGAVVGAMKLTCEEKLKLLGQLPKILESAHKGKFLMNVYFEEHKEDDFEEFKSKLGIRSIQ